MKCQRSVESHPDQPDIGILTGRAVHTLLDHLSYAVTVTIDDEANRMVIRHLTLYLAPSRIREEVRGHINLSQR